MGPRRWGCVRGCWISASPPTPPFSFLGIADGVSYGGGLPPDSVALGLSTVSRPSLCLYRVRKGMMGWSGVEQWV